jgi:hypothetical protein
MMPAGLCYASVALVAYATAAFAGPPEVTYTREISRLMYDRCVMCHHRGGRMFSMTNYEETRRWVKSIQEEVLERRMPPWGAIEGFGEFENDLSLTEAQIELISQWVDRGMPEGDPQFLPKLPEFAPPAPGGKPRGVPVQDGFRLKHAMVLLGVRGGDIWQGNSLRAVAERLDGSIEPLVWLYDFKPWFAHPYWYKVPVRLPAGSRIVITPADSGDLVLLTSRPKRVPANRR